MNIIHEDIKDIVTKWNIGDPEVHKRHNNIIGDCMTAIAKKDYSPEEFIEAGYYLCWFLERLMRELKMKGYHGN